MALINNLNAILDKDFQKIHDASLQVMQETGVVFHNDAALEIFKKNGAKVSNKTVFFTPNMVEKALETCPSKFQWEARNTKNSVTVGEGFLTQPNLGAVFIQDLDEGRRLGTLKDLANIQKLSQASDSINLVGSLPVDPSDVDNDEKHLRVMYEILRNTDKPVIGFTCGDSEKAKQTLDMVKIAVGEDETFKDKHHVAVAINPLSPLGYSGDALDTIMEYAKLNQIIFLAPCIMAGVSGPIHLLGTALLQNIEILAGIVFTQLINPGNPVVYSTASHPANMKTASFVAGSPEGLLLDIAGIQMGLNFYKIPTRVMAGISDSKVVDAQAGYETMQNLLLSALSGANIGVQCSGSLDSVMTTCYEKMIIDNELMGRVRRIKEGIEVSDESLSMDIIQEVGSGGTFLTHESTFKNFRNKWVPTLSEVDSYQDWKKAGSKDVLVKANKKYKEILQNAPETLIDAEVDKDLKAYISKIED